MNQPGNSVSKHPFGGGGGSNVAKPQKQWSRAEIFDASLDAQAKKFAVPPHLKLDRFLRSARIAVWRAPKLLECEMESLLAALQQAAVLGLEVSGMLGSAHLVPYGKTATLIIGYKGLIGLARQSGEIESIDAFAVHENDRLHVHFGTDPKIEHEPQLDSEPGRFRLVYAVAKLRGGGMQFVLMTKAEVEVIRKGSKAGNSGPWITHYEEMAKKTAIRRLCKYLPMSVEKIARALEVDDAADAGMAPLPEKIDSHTFSQMIDDANAAADRQGAPGAIDAAIEAASSTAETTTREPGMDEPEGTTAEPANPFTAAAEPAKPKESFADVAKRAAAKAGGA